MSSTQDPDRNESPDHDQRNDLPAAFILLVLIASPFVYFLSTGLVLRMYVRDRVSLAFAEWYCYPLAILHKHTPLQGLLEKWSEWWLMG